MDADLLDEMAKAIEMDPQKPLDEILAQRIDEGIKKILATTQDRKMKSIWSYLRFVQSRITLMQDKVDKTLEKIEKDICDHNISLSLRCVDSHFMYRNIDCIYKRLDEMDGYIRPGVNSFVHTQ